MGHVRKTEASIEKWSWMRDRFLGLGFHFEEGIEEDLILFAFGCDKRAFFSGGEKTRASDRDRFGAGDEGGVECGEEVEGSGARSSGGGDDEERADLLLLL